jgi:flagellar L-ring protein precursor FlgH
MTRLDKTTKTAQKIMLAAVLLSTTACGTMADRLSQIGEPPPMSPISNPTHAYGYRPVSMPMPEPQVVERQANSLWRSGSRAFFKDQRASRVGDILTIMIEINDKAELENQTTRTRNTSENLGVPNMLGFEGELGSILPETVDPSALLGVTGSTNNTGNGSIGRTEKINLQVAGVITQILPNGNLVMQGSQEIRVNYEVRVLNISGVIRPEDITSANTISYEKIAEARINYGGRGQITDVQQPRYGSQVLDIISPF